MRQGIALIVFSLVFVPAAFVQAQSINFNVNFPTVKDDFMRDAPKHTQFITVKNFTGSVEYGMRVVDADTGEVIPSGQTVSKGTRLKLEFLPETMSYFTTGSQYDSPYAKWVTGAPPVQCLTEERVFHYNKLYKGRPGILSIFAPVFAKRPAHSVTNATALGDCTGPEDGRICTAENVGTHNLTFTWAPSTASMYLRVYNKDDTKHAQPHSRWPRYDRCEPFGPLSSQTDFAGGAKNEPQSTVTLPQKTKPFTIVVEEAPEDPHDPNKPTVTANTAACVAGQAHSIKIKGTDPDGDDVRYQIDWLNNGTITYLPENRSYVNSGTELTASKTFATAGSKTVKVRTEDEHGGKSAWTTLTFTCTEGADVCPNLTGTQPVVPQDYQIVGGQCVPIDPNLDQCTNITGIQSTIPPGLIRIGSECLEGEFGDGPSINDLSLRAVPSLVRPNGTTKVHWSSQNMTACTVTATNSDTWTGLESEEGGYTSSPIAGLVIYTLSCRGTDGETYSKTARVNVVPNWQETPRSGGQ